MSRSALIAVVSFALLLARCVVPANATSTPAASPTVILATPTPTASPTAPAMQAAQATPTPQVTPLDTKPGSDLSISGVLRAYQFDKQTTEIGTSQSAFNIGGGVHAGYKFHDSGFEIGVSYYGAYPFGLNGVHSANNALVDNSLPGYAFSAFPEAYLRYVSPRFQMTVGNQFLSYKWANEADATIMPQAFQGIEASYVIVPNLTVSVARVIRFESRTASQFGQNTLLTGNAEVPGLFLENVEYATKQGSLLFEDYSFYNIANLQYAEMRANLDVSHKLYVAAQYVGEQESGSALLGRVQNHTYGAELGVNMLKNVGISFGFDDSPAHYAAAAEAEAFYAPTVNATSPFLAYGGIATPYTPSSDPLYTTSINQGIADTGRTGPSYKMSLLYATTNKRLTLAVSRAVYSTTTAIAGTATSENDVDVTYFLNPVNKTGPYHGFSVRQRYADLRSPSLNANPMLIRNRTQLQYTF